MVSHQIVALPGDGIGPEVVAEAIKVLETIQNASSSNITFNIASHDFGGIAIDNHGDPLPESTLSACKASDAIILGQFGGVVRAYKVLMVLTFNASTKPLRIHWTLFIFTILHYSSNSTQNSLPQPGAVGGPKWGVGKVRPEQGILRLRKELDLYANIRPALFPSDSLIEKSPLKGGLLSQPQGRAC